MTREKERDCKYKRKKRLDSLTRLYAACELICMLDDARLFQAEQQQKCLNIKNLNTTTKQQDF